MNSIGVPELIVIVAMLVGWLSITWPAARLCRRLGLSPWLGIFALVPVANVILLWYVAFARWPIDASGQRGT
jgi:hypothetical protein